MKEKIPVAILGATGMVGQKFIELLTNHPWFEVVALAASEKSSGKPYSEATRWRLSSNLDHKIAKLNVLPCTPNLPCKIVFSGLDSSVAGDIEQNFADAGYLVISNSKNHRMHPFVPLVIPEVNSDHLLQMKSNIVTNPNCSVIGLTTALKPLDKWGIEKVHVTTMQAISGAGYPGVASLDILDNLIPFIQGEEEKVETEPLKIMGALKNGQIIPHSMQISAQCNRVAVIDGHTACVSVKLSKKTTQAEMIEAWSTFLALDLPSSPKSPIIYLTDESHPQPKLHRNLGQGMSVSIGRLRPCPIFDWKFVILSHNTIRGAAGCALLNAELLVKNSSLDFFI